jgi:hypothetical protein
MEGERWEEAEEAIATIAPICTQHDPDGIDIYFLNHRNRTTRSGGYHNITTPSGVQEIFRTVRPFGQTPVGKCLHRILYPYLRRVESMAEATDEYGDLRNPDLAVRPVNIIVITDGIFTDDAYGVIADAAKILDRCKALPWQMGIQFFQIGHEQAGKDNLVRN